MKIAKAKRATRRIRSVAIVLGIFLAFCVITRIPVFETVLVNRQIDKETGDVRSIVTACIAFSMDNDGKFPPNLHSLIPDYVDDESILTYNINGSHPYLYRPGLDETNRSREPLIISPPNENGDRLIGYVGGHVAESGTVPPEILAEFE